MRDLQHKMSPSLLSALVIIFANRISVGACLTVRDKNSGMFYNSAVTKFTGIRTVYCSLCAVKERIGKIYWSALKHTFYNGPKCASSYD